MPRTRGPRAGAGSLFAPPGAQARRLTGPVYVPIMRRSDAIPTAYGMRSYPVSAIETPYVNPAFAQAGNPYSGPYAQAQRPWSAPFTGEQARGYQGMPTGTLAERGIYLPITAADEQGRTVSSLTGLPAGGVGGGWPAGTTGQAPGTLPVTGGAGTAGGGTSGGWKVPPGIDAGWYNQFRQEHGGETPEDFYGRQREGLSEALADREWGEGFHRMYGRAPGQEDWQAHYYATRGGNPQWAAMTKAQRKAERKLSKQSGRNWWAKQQGYLNWADYKRKTDEENKPRAPLYQPPQIFWR